MNINHTRRGFTLLELLATIAIIGILSLISTVVANAALEKNRNVQRVSQSSQLQLALERYYDSYGQYPMPACTAGARQNGVDQLKSLILEFTDSVPLDPIYGKIIPKTPQSGIATDLTNWHDVHWHYIVSGAADNYQHYILQAELENAGSPSLMNDTKLIRGSVMRYRDASTSSPNGSYSISVQTGSWTTNCSGRASTFYPDDGPLVMCGYTRWPGTGVQMRYYCVGNVGKQPTTGGCDGVLESPAVLSANGLTSETLTSLGAKKPMNCP